MDMKFDIVSIGEILSDFVPGGYDENGDAVFISKAGGAPLNVLATASRFGLKTSFIGKVGNDIFGKMLIKTLADNSIDNAVAIDSVHNTTLAFVSLDANGDRDFSFYRNFGADIFLNKKDIDADKIRNAGIFHFGSLSFTDEPVSSSTEYALKIAKESGCIISYDPNYRAPLWKSESDAVEQMRKNLHFADIVKLSLDEAKMITGESDVFKAAVKIADDDVKAVIITNGAGDIVYCVDGKCSTVSVEKINAVDTTGAGDIFFGCVLSKFLLDNISLAELDNDKMKKYITYASAVAGKSVLKKGAIASIPDIDV